MSITTPRLRRNQDNVLAPPPPRKSIGGLRLLRRLGAGGMSEVYLAYDEARHFPVAVKVLPDDLALNSNYVQRFVREYVEIKKLIAEPTGSPALTIPPGTLLEQPRPAQPTVA